MKKKVLASLMCVAMAATMLAGCGAAADTAATTDDAAATTTTAASTEAAAPAEEADASAGGDYTFEIIVKSYQSSYWQAAVRCKPGS